MKLVVGLGNPGDQYRYSRHNVGFLAVDDLAEKLNINLGRRSFSSVIGFGNIQETRLVLAKPQTYMNLSGYAVKEIKDYFQVAPHDLVVIHDDLDLPFGTIRLKKSGGFAGHKGLQSVARSLQTSDFIRVRLGIGRPQENIPVEKYVLSSFSPEEMEALPAILARAGEAVADLISLGIQAAMARHHIKHHQN